MFTISSLNSFHILLLAIFLFFNIGHGQYQNSIFELSNNVKDFDDFNDDDYFSDQPIKKTLLKNYGLLKNHFYEFHPTPKYNTLTEKIKDKKLTDTNSLVKDFKIISNVNNRKTTDWLSMDDIQSDQPKILESKEESKLIDDKNEQVTSPMYSLVENKNPNQKSVPFTPPYLANYPGYAAKKSGPIHNSLKKYPEVNYPHKKQYQQQPSKAKFESVSNQVAHPNQIFTANLFSCQITSANNCSLVNDPQVLPLFQLKNHNYFPLKQPNGHNWYLMFNTSTVPVTQIGGRLITPYLPFNKASKGKFQC